MTQAELAEAAGLSVQMLAALEQAAKTPSLATIDSLCTALRVRASELFAAGEAKQAPVYEPAHRVNLLLRDLPRRQQDEVVDIVASVCRLVRQSRAR